MSSLLATIAIIFLLTVFSYFVVREENKLKSSSVVFLVMLMLFSSTLSTEWSRMTSELVEEAEDPHYGLPDIWDGEQVVCFHFSSESAPPGFNDGRHHIDSDGTDFKTDKNWNTTGACVGGFEGYNIGIDLLNAAVSVTGDNFALNVTDYGELGLFVNSIGGINPCEQGPCGDNIWTSWKFLHNGVLSFSGISALTLDDDSVITFQIVTETW